MRLGLQKTTVVNFPRRLAAAVFLPGCNMRCGYCHNAELALANTQGKGLENSFENQYYKLEDVFAHLENRAKVLSGFVISGGEPLLSPALKPLVLKAKSLGLKVKIDTNGLFPEKLEYLLNSSEVCPDMVALDVKTSPERYVELMPNRSKQTAEIATSSIIKTLDLLKTISQSNSGVEIEYRTVLIPGLVGDAEIKAIAQNLPKNADWKLANFLPGHCLNPDWNEIRPYTPAEANRLENLAKTIIPHTEIR
ncbi:MAG: anaerobic ribonucleoside-triphosphate reductase activating protein [Treponema sp.]|nr:MAG: anaerobic ribonucleoside-triphosphate reductase activating protein [Treponema sp.]